MTTRNDFETTLRDTLSQAEAELTESADLLDRLLAVPQRPARRTPHRVSLSTARRWGLPLLAAAAVAALAIGVTSAVSGTDAAPHRPAGSVTPEPAVPLPIGFQAAGAYFATPSQGWALGNVPCAAGPGYCATLSSTTDGGHRWSELSLPSGLTPVDDQGHPEGGSCGTNGTIYGPCVDRVAFADPQHGYVWSLHAFYSTSDGGRSWQRDPRPDLGATQLVIAGDRVVRLIPLHECSAGCDGELQTARVGDSDWTPLALGGNSTPSLFGSRLAADGDTISVLTDALYFSTDAGTSWHKGALPCGTDQNTSAWLGPSGAVTLGCSNMATTLYFSANAGATFEPGVPSSTEPDQVLVAGPGRAVTLTTRGETTRFALTSNGGRNWRTVANTATGTPAQTYSLPTGRFVTTDFGFAIVDGRLWLSTDGGQDWSPAR